ncbi:hypothetical protein J3R73_000492 [Labrys monachus]|uniref:Transposase n=1 Tax=Labrys monachus TaxID=217067 RepID=A0ABU0F7W1_9HYPH|nr:hypothetical protein [Labrys monachus]
MAYCELAGRTPDTGIAKPLSAKRKCRAQWKHCGILATVSPMSTREALGVPISFRLYAGLPAAHLAIETEYAWHSQKKPTQHLRELAQDRLTERADRYLMKRTGIEAIYPRANTSRPTRGHKIYPYILRKLAVTKPNQVWATDLAYIPMRRSFVYPLARQAVAPAIAVRLAAAVDWFGRRVCFPPPRPKP